MSSAEMIRDLRTTPAPMWVAGAVDIACRIDKVDAANVFEVLITNIADPVYLVTLAADPETPYWAKDVIEAMFTDGLENAAPHVARIAAAMVERCFDQTAR